MLPAVAPLDVQTSTDTRSPAERDELDTLRQLIRRQRGPCAPSVPRHAISAPTVLNEAYAYARPSSFSRGLRLPLGDATLLLLSGTASIDEAGGTVHAGDFRAQLLRTYRNLTALLAAEGATWHDVVRTSCYLRDIERDYRDFNEIRTAFFAELQVDPLPASTGIQARLCREDLLVEIEAMAVIATRTPVRS